MGQQSSDRITVRWLVRGLSRHLGMERGILRTCVDLTVRPGSMLQGYLEGRDRDRHTSVFLYVGLVVAATLILESLAPIPIDWTGWDAEFGAGEGDRLRAVFGRRGKLLILLAVPIMAAATRTAFSKWELAYVEHLVVNAFVLGHALLLAILVYPLYFGPLRSALLLVLEWGLAAYYVFALSSLGSGPLLPNLARACLALVIGFPAWAFTSAAVAAVLVWTGW